MIFNNLNDKNEDKLTFTGQRLSREHADYIKLLVTKAGEKDRERKVFGAKSHQYKLNPVIAMKDVHDYECKYNIQLPEEYVFFLTQVGNGGAGPYYGLFPLEQTIKHIPKLDCLSNEPLINTHLTKEEWNLMIHKSQKADDNKSDKIIWKICSGFIVLGTQGCTYDHILLLSGPDQGKVFNIDWNLEPDYPPCFTGMAFLEWYENFFIEIISKHDVYSYGYIRLGSEENLIKDYPNASLKNKTEILESFFRFSKVKKDTLKFLLQKDNISLLDGLRTQLLFKFDLHSAIKMLNTLIDENDAEAIVSCLRSIPVQIKEKYYQTMLNLLYSENLDEEQAEKIIFFLKNCSCFLGRDLIPFATNTKNHEDNRHTAIWAIGTSSDKMDYLDEFISWMKGDSYWIAHAALQAMSKEHHPKLLDTYRWMWNKYQNDSTMRSNLERAFSIHGITMPPSNSK